jgi:hypothetical protein
MCDFSDSSEIQTKTKNYSKQLSNPDLFNKIFIQHDNTAMYVTSIQLTQQDYDEHDDSIFLALIKS